MPEDREREFWIRRLEAIGKAQARYLWLLLIAALFYAALYARSSASATITVPVVQLELDTLTVLASGGPIIAFLVLVIIGAIRAWTHALEQVRGTRPAKDSEQLDTHPNAIDLAIYTTDRSPSTIKQVTYFAYPLLLLAGLAESAILAWWLWRTPSVGARPVFLILQLVTWVPAAVLVIGMVVTRIGQLPSRGSAA
jgi:hypothetical protein